MTVQTIKTTDNREYVLLPVVVYRALKDEIESALKTLGSKEGDADRYEPFVLEDYVGNPVALARIRADLTQQQLAEAMGVSQPYVAKLEAQEKITPKMLAKVRAAAKNQWGRAR